MSCLCLVWIHIIICSVVIGSVSVLIVVVLIEKASAVMTPETMVVAFTERVSGSHSSAWHFMDGGEWDFCLSFLSVRHVVDV